MQRAHTPDGTFVKPCPPARRAPRVLPRGADSFAVTRGAISAPTHLREPRIKVQSIRNVVKEHPHETHGHGGEYHNFAESQNCFKRLILAVATAAVGTGKASSTFGWMYGSPCRQSQCRSINGVCEGTNCFGNWAPAKLRCGQ